jgi:DNA-binding NtrC family response regulator
VCGGWSGRHSRAPDEPYNFRAELMTSPKRILLVDDERSIRESLSKILRAENYEIVLAENGQEAIEKHSIARIDLLILDLNMPVKSGLPTLKWLVEINPLLPVVVITGRSNQSALADTAGADVLMEKPLDVPLLLQTIRELVDEPLESRTQRANSRASAFRSVPRDDPENHQRLLKRFTAPNP